MTRTGYDAIHANALNIPRDAEVVFFYATGTPLIRWTPADLAAFPRALKIGIDQGAAWSPVLTATVRDVETGAWTPVSATHQTEGWNVPRPTIYCNRDTLPQVLLEGWKGDLWLAIPSPSAPVSPPEVPGCNVVAIQWYFGTQYDKSVIFDDTWPRGAVMDTVELQQNWRWCRKCQSLFYGPNEASSVCAAGGKHDGSQSGDYPLIDVVTTTVPSA